MKPKLKITLSILLSLSVIVFIVLWDTVIKDRIDSVEVVVVKPGVIIEKNEPISEDKIMIEKRNRNSIVEGVVYKENLPKIIGMEANTRLLGNSLLSERYIDFDSMTPDTALGESIRPIPNQWIYASPSTIRRKDHVNFYLFKPEDQQGESPTVKMNGLSPEQKANLDTLKARLQAEDQKYKKESNAIAKDNGVKVSKEQAAINDTIATTEEAAQLAVETKGEALKGTHQEDMRAKYMNELHITESDWTSLAENGEIPVLLDIPVVYVKDSAGNEIEDVKDKEAPTSANKDERLTATGQITNFEVILNEDEYRAIKRYMETGYKLYVTYN